MICCVVIFQFKNHRLIYSLLPDADLLLIYSLMSDAAPLLIRYRDRRLLAPGHGITCPQELQAELITNGFIADSNTVTDVHRLHVADRRPHA